MTTNLQTACHSAHAHETGLLMASCGLFMVMGASKFGCLEELRDSTQDFQRISTMASGDHQ